MASAGSSARITTVPSPARARHHTDLEGLKRIQAKLEINPGRADPPVNQGVHVEIEPFGPTQPGLDGPKADLGAATEGAFDEFDLPSHALPTFIGPRNTAVIPTNGPLSIRELNPRFVRVRCWWNLWFFWR